MRFITQSGATYDLFRSEGDLYITRDSQTPIRHVLGGDMDELVASRVFFTDPPEVGQSFAYFTDTHAGCVSTPVVSIEGALP